MKKEKVTDYSKHSDLGTFELYLYNQQKSHQALSP